MTRIQLPCGCPVTVDFAKGERRVVCAGDGLTADDRPLEWKVCKGGRGYVIAAKEETTVRYSVRAMPRVVEEAS